MQCAPVRHYFTLNANGIFFVGVQGDLVLYRPDRANGPHVCPLRAERCMQVQTLGCEASVRLGGRDGLPQLLRFQATDRNCRRN